MKGFWKKIYRKTAVALTAALLVTSAVPMTGMAQTFDLGFIDNLDLGGDLEDYVATASVAAKIVESDSENEIRLASASNYCGEANIAVQAEVTVAKVATASDAVATDSNASDIEDAIATAIAGKVIMKATVSDADKAIKDYISVDTDPLIGGNPATVTVDASEATDLPEGEYKVVVTFTPEMDESLPDRYFISSTKPASYEITVIVGEETSKVSEIRFKGFDNGKETQKTWIYVGDKPVDLMDYCITDAAYKGSDIIFQSDDPSVAGIEGTVLTPKEKGTAVITAEIKEGDKVVAKGKLQVDVWITKETTETMPPAFELNEDETWIHVFAGDRGVATGGFTTILKEDGTEADVNDEAKVSIKFDKENHTSTIEVKGKRAGKYTLRCAWHGDDNTTYFGYIDFTVKEVPHLSSLKIGFKGFNEDDRVNEDGTILTWTYMKEGDTKWGDVWLRDYCSVEEGPSDAVITFTSSDSEVASIDESGVLHPKKTGRITVTATVTAAGYESAADSMIIDIWAAKEQHNLPDEITLQAGETWTHTFAEALNGRTKVLVYDMRTGKLADENAVKASLSEDFKTLTVETREDGEYRLLYRAHKEENLSTKYEEMFISVLKANVSLNLSVDQLVLEPGASAAFDVTFTPGDAYLDLDYDKDLIKAVYADGRITVTAADLASDSENEETWLVAVLYTGEAAGENRLALKEIPIYIVKKQLEADTVEGLLGQAADKLEEIMADAQEGYIPPAVYKIVDEVIETLAAAPKAELQANKDVIDRMEQELSKVSSVGNEVCDDAEIEVSGALLNLVSMGETDGKMVVESVEDTTNESGVTLEIKLQRGSNGKNITNLAVPMQLRLKVSGIDLTRDIRIKHTKEDGSAEWIYPEVEGEYLVFWVDSYSTFAISNYTASSGGSGGGGSSSSSSRSTAAAGVISSDAKKGYVNSLTGIITGSGAGYSKWNQDENGWKLQYADGTFAAGVMTADEAGSTHEQVAWEMINGAWYPFGANGYVKSGFVYDVALGGTFYVDINTGMKTGWQQIDGVWHYFSSVSDGKRGIMLKDTTVDGYYIDAEGIWR